VEQKKLKMMIQFSRESRRSDLLGERSGELRKEDLVEFGDILEAASRSLRERIQSESTLTIELNGQVRLEKSVDPNIGLDQFVVFTVSGGLTSERTTAMKLVLETKIAPSK
jgi:hypothetical protein